MFSTYGEKFSLLLLDIDDFKQINDSFGHLVGDEALKKISTCIKDATRESDAVFRYGGEEFAVVLPGTGLESAVFVAEKVRQSVDVTVFEIDGIRLRIQVNVGVAGCPEHGETARALIERSNRAMMRAKKAGKNQVVTWEETS